jgi:outer membrane protein TolC
MRHLTTALILVLAAANIAAAQNSTSPARLPLVQPVGISAAPIVITLQDALERAQEINVDVQSAFTEVKSAGEDRLQAKASLLPSVNHTTQYLGTQGNGTLPSGRFVSNDGVHLYRDWGVVHEDITANTILKTGSQRAEASEALAKAKAEIAQRGLSVIVTRNYYSLVTAQRKYATAQLGSQEATRFLELTGQQERLGEVAHYDVVKAQIQSEQQQQAFDDATLAMENARLNLAVLLFRSLNENFTVVDDLESTPNLPAFDDIRKLAERENPEIRAANHAVRQANLDIRVARNSSLPTLSLDLNYGIEANAFARHSTVAAAPEAGVLPNMGYFITANLTIPIFDWGNQKSKVRQAQLREEQAKTRVGATERQLSADLLINYDEAIAARTAVDRARRTMDLATEGLNLSNSRYRGGVAPASEVVESQNAVVKARNDYADAQSRFRVAISMLQNITGSF